MGKIFYLMGKSSSGKDTIFKELLQRSGQNADVTGLRTIVPYTTRPIRAGEQEGVEYHFTDEAGFQKLLGSGKVIEQREYHTFHGLWRYFTVDDGQFVPEGRQDYLMIGTLEAYQSMQRYFGAEKVLPVLIELDDGVRLQRALDREKKQQQPKYEEMCRRFLADSEDFSEDKIKAAGIDRRFQNDCLEGCLAEIVEYIRQYG
jgi:guanylate kinase